MNEGISFDEACAMTPDALTNEQYANCPGVTTSSEWIMYVVIGVILTIVLASIFLWLRKRSSLGTSS